MFNSTWINTDPKPYIVQSIEDGDYRVSVEGYCGYRTKFEPRPEYDNKPNQILWNLRNSILQNSDAEKVKTYKAWQYLIKSDLVEPGEIYHSKEHLEHALKVLNRLMYLASVDNTTA